MRRRRWLLLGLIIGAGILNYADRQIIAVLKPVMEVDMKWTDADYGRLASLFQFAAAVGFIFTGGIVDRVGFKWANPLGVAAWSLAAMAHGLARTMGQFALVRLALGASESMGTPASIKATAALFSERQRSTAIGISNAAGNIGAIITPLIVPLIAVSFGWRATFVVVGAAGFVWVLGWVAATRGLEADTPPAASTVGAARAYLAMLRDRRTWAIAGAKALSDQVWWLLLFWTPDFFHRQFGLGLQQIGAPLAVIYACAASGSLIGGYGPARLMRRGVSLNRARKGALLVCALLATSAPLIPRVQTEGFAVALIGLLLAAHQGFSVNLFSLIADVSPPERVGGVTGFCALCGNLAGMGILYLAGELLMRGYGYRPLFAIAACSYLLGVGWIQLLMPRIDKPDGTPGHIDGAKGAN
jgi:ACS family hexuronate transporter-like MFS transporter